VTSSTWYGRVRRDLIAAAVTAAITVTEEAEIAAGALFVEIEKAVDGRANAGDDSKAQDRLLREPAG